MAKRIGHLIKVAREEKGLTQDGLAARLDIGRSGVANIETGRSLITVDHLIRLPKILHKSVNHFLDIPDDLPAEEIKILEMYRSLTSPKSKRLLRRSIEALLEDEKDGEL